MKRHYDDAMIGCLTVDVVLVAAFVKIVSCLANSHIFVAMVTRPLLKFVSLYIGSNYLCTNLEMGSLSLSQNGSHFSR